MSIDKEIAKLSSGDRRINIKRITNIKRTISGVRISCVHCRSKALKAVIGKTKKLIEEMGVSQDEKAEGSGKNAGKEKEYSPERENEGKTGE